MKFALYVIVVIVALLLISVLYFFQFAVYYKPFRVGKDKAKIESHPRIREGMEWYSNQAREWIYEKSFDGLSLAAEYLPADVETLRGVLILMHGFRGSVARDFSCAVRFYHELGFHLLLPHQRAHGKSEGRFLTFGVKERYDCQMWANYTKERFGADLPIFLDGISMGASTVLMAAGLELPENVKGIIADCGFTSPWDIFRVVMKKWFKLPAFPMLHLTSAYSKLVAGFGFKDYSTQEALKNSHLPVLFVHGTADELVPSWMSEANYQACHGPKQLVLVEGAAHGFSFLEDEEQCKEALISFFEQYES